MKVNP
jgi:hypothetical protein